MVFQGRNLKLVSQRNGKELIFHAGPDDDHLVEYLAPLTHLLTRQFKPAKSIVVETINGEPALNSPYLEVFETVFSVVRDLKHVTLYRREDSFF